MGQILSYPADTTPATGDKFLFQDGSSNATKYMTYGTLKDSIAGAAWLSWTPTLVSLSGGTTEAKYVQVGKTVKFYFKYTLAGAGVSTNPSFTLPTAAITGYGTVETFNASYIDSSAGTIGPLVGFLTSTTVCRIGALTSGGTYTGVANADSTVPITWATGDILCVAGQYEAA